MSNKTHLRKGFTLNQNNYRIEKSIGQGGYGITYLAADQALNRWVAIKEFFPQDYCLRDPQTGKVSVAVPSNEEFFAELKERFVKEARNIASLNDPGIVRIHTAFEDNNTAYYVMDYIEGQSLDEIVSANGRLPLDTAIKYTEQVGHTLQYLHSRNMTHLDVKPANIMLRASDHQPILIDFGLSKRYNKSGKETTVSTTGLSHGFAPMEQYDSSGLSTFSPQSDLYALAATFYFLVTGNIPPHAADLATNPSRLTFPADFPSYLQGPIVQAMSAQKASRHSDVVCFINHLTRSYQYGASAQGNYGPPGGNGGGGNGPVSGGHTIASPISQQPPKQDFYEQYAAQKQKKEGGSTAMIVLVSALAFLIAVGATWYFLADSSQEKTEQQTTDSPTEYTSQKTTEQDYRNASVSMATGSREGYDYVDLGLPSGTLWATQNVGASSPGSYGGYYSWGETYTKDYYYEHNSDTRGVYMDDIEGDSGHDAAASSMGGGWQMPSKKDFQELLKNCKWYWESYDGKKGFKVVGPNLNAIFLPAAGYMWETSPRYRGKWGYYLTSTPDKNDSYKCYVLDFDGTHHKDLHTGYRASGRTIRPVLKN